MAKDQDSPRLSVNEVADILQTRGNSFLQHQFSLARETHSQDAREITVPFLARVKEGVEIPGTLSRIQSIIAVNTSYENLAKHLKSGDIYSVEASREGGSFHN